MIGIIARHVSSPWKQSSGIMQTFCRSLAAVPQKLQLVKDLRESSGAPISDVKGALDEAKYDIGEAGHTTIIEGMMLLRDSDLTRYKLIGIEAVSTCRCCLSTSQKEGPGSCQQKGE